MRTPPSPTVETFQTPLRTTLHYADNGAGWKIALKQTAPATPRGRPVLLVPGYQMNASIFGFHPNGPSLEAYLASRGIEVWSVDLRGQGRARRAGGTDRFGLGDLAVDDLGTAIACVLRASPVARARKDGVDLIGCSLGAALAFAHVACVPAAPVRSIVSMGGLVTWVHVNRALRVVSHAPWLVGRIRLRNSRALARVALPVIARVAPRLLSIYMSTGSTDVSQSDVMVETVEDANAQVNVEIAEWIARRDLVVRGVNVSAGLAAFDKPYLCVVGNQDGVVPPATARATFDAVGSRDKELLCVGDDETRIAHADLFLATCAPTRIFGPIADFLLARA